MAQNLVLNLSPAVSASKPEPFRKLTVDEHRLLLGILEGNAEVVREAIDAGANLRKPAFANCHYTLAELAALTNRPEVLKPVLDAIVPADASRVATGDVELIGKMITGFMNVAVGYRSSHTDPAAERESRTARADLQANLPKPVLSLLRSEVDAQMKAGTFHPNAEACLDMLAAANLSMASPETRKAMLQTEP